MSNSDVRFDLEQKVDAEIDRQLDTRIAQIERRLFGSYWNRDLVSYRFVPESLDIPRGVFEERCVARGFKRVSDALWARSEYEESPPYVFDTDRVGMAAQEIIVAAEPEIGQPFESLSDERRRALEDLWNRVRAASRTGADGRRS